VRQTILATSLTGQELPLTKSPTGISGFDTISGGGLPDGRLSVIVGGPGAGKTVFALHCLVHRLTWVKQAFSSPSRRMSIAYAPTWLLSTGPFRAATNS
jgi:hypothetical protein